MIPDTSPPVWSWASVLEALEPHRVGAHPTPGSGAREENAVFSGIVTDTRDIVEGALFVALTGERFDGHDFVAEAFRRGAAGAVVDREVEGEGPHFRVDDTLRALGALARHRRRLLGKRGTRVVGITGSSGKTTVKEMVRAALSTTWRTHATSGNWNNRIGVPLTIFAAPGDTGVLVLEMGTSEPGEIAALAAIGEPGIGVVTTVGAAHLERLGSIAGVLVEKCALVEALPPSGWAVVGDTPPELAARARTLCDQVRVAGWGEGADPDLRPADPVIDARGCWSFTWEGERVTLQLPGRAAATDALLALAVARLLRVPAAAAAAGISGVLPAGLRGERRAIGGLIVLVDCYNANPQSLRAALDTLAETPAPGGRVAVLGSMLELGEGSAELHRELLAHAISLPLQTIVAVGLFATAAREVEGSGPSLLAASGVEEASALLSARLSGGETVLLKGSRGVALERLLPGLEQTFGGGAAQPSLGEL